MKKIESPFIFFLVLILFIASLFLIIKGLLTSKPKEDIGSTEKSAEEESYQEGSSLSQYFDESSFDELDDQEFLKNDPFKDMCAATSGNGLPSVSSNTVCIR